MSALGELFISVLAVAVAAAALLALAFLISLAAPVRHRGWVRRLHHLVERFFALGGSMVVLGVIISTLVVSELIGYEPCELCWYQRIALYPQLVLFGLALIRPGRTVDALAVALLSLVGMIFAGIHVSVQFSGAAAFCGIGEASCQTIYFIRFGFLTMPGMALVLFFLLLIASVAVMQNKRGSRSFA